ncbi:hypothetical protein HanPSC8_Chr10g0419161 [Helianthus annuus]|nr:hypothetical protein HanPSC8_Chr10g0419161 [Helianthus annuus]
MNEKYCRELISKSISCYFLLRLTHSTGYHLSKSSWFISYTSPQTIRPPPSFLRHNPSPPTASGRPYPSSGTPS